MCQDIEVLKWHLQQLTLPWLFHEVLHFYIDCIHLHWATARPATWRYHLPSYTNSSKMISCHTVSLILSTIQETLWLVLLQSTTKHPSCSSIRVEHEFFYIAMQQETHNPLLHGISLRREKVAFTLSKCLHSNLVMTLGYRHWCLIGYMRLGMLESTHVWLLTTMDLTWCTSMSALEVSDLILTIILLHWLLT